MAAARNWLDGEYAVKNGVKYEWKEGKETTIKYPTFQGLTYSMNYTNQNDAFNISKALTESGNIYGLSSSSTDSHLMKNSEMKDNYILINKQIKDNKIKFEYYNNKQVPLNLIQIYHNQIDDTIELKFRNIMQEYLDEIKEITNKNEK